MTYMKKLLLISLVLTRFDIQNYFFAMNSNANLLVFYSILSVRFLNKDYDQ